MKEKRKIKITYKDEFDKKKVVVNSVDSKYDNIDNSVLYSERVEDYVCEMAEGGGFWSNSNKIIPYHRVLCIETVPIKKEPNDPPVDEVDKPEKVNITENTKSAENTENLEDNKDSVVEESHSDTPQPSKKKVNHRRTHRKNLKTKSKK